MSPVITTLVLEVEVQPPSDETCVFCVALRTFAPPICQVISAGGLEGAVVQVRGTMSPTRASLDPEIETVAGATV